MFKFINAQKMQKKYPDTFKAPTKEDLNALIEDKIVKVSHKNERFWVIITKIEDDIITGKVDNDLISNHPFKYGDTIKFKKHHIYSIYD